MDMYEETFKLQDMIDSDIRTQLEECQAADMQDMPILTALTPAEPLDNAMETEWLQSSPLYGIDVDLGNSILVNPQTGAPIGLIQPQTVSTPTSTVTLSVVSAQSLSSSPTMVISQPTTVQITHIVAPQCVSETLSNSSLQNIDHQKLNITVPVTTSSLAPKIAAQATCVKSLPQIVIRNQKSIAENQVATLKTKHKGKTNNNKESFGPNNGQVFRDKLYPKPAYSYSCLIAMALKNSQTGSLPVNEIYNFMIENFPYFKTAPNGWKNSVRHNLSLNKCFEKVEQPIGNGSQRKGCLWAMNPAKVVKMDEELQKWSNKDPIAIRRSMANPERLSLLEKGHLKNLQPDHTHFNSGIENDETEGTNKADKKQDIAEVDKVEPPSVDMPPPLEDSMNLDSSLHDIGLQKGIWELYDDRLHFINDTLSPSSSPTNIEDDNEKHVLISDAKNLSFIHGNYVCSEANNGRKTNSPLDGSSQVLLHLPSVKNKDNIETKCNS